MKLDSDIAAVVTGGASGLGAATARILSEAGCRVAVLDLDEVRGGATAAAAGGVFCRCDVTDSDSVARALQAARSAHGQERIAVACAGVATAAKTAARDRKTGIAEPHDPATYLRAVMVNLVGTFHIASQSAAGMLDAEPLGADNERGVIVMTASAAAEDGQIGQLAYAASKGGVAAMTLPMARDLARDGIRAVTILPGLFDTPMFDSLGEDVRAALARSVPFPSRLGNPDDYAGLVRHICENVMLNGANIRLDGAIRLPPR